MFIIICFFLAVLCTIILFYIFSIRPSLGKAPHGERLHKIKKSTNYINGQFRNLTPTVLINNQRPFLLSLYDFLFRKAPNVRPKEPIDSQKQDLFSVDKNKNFLVWLGHSSLYFQLDKKRILVDPVFKSASPVPGINKAFKGTNVYSLLDFPPIDYIFITHDHYDHLDYKTMRFFRKTVRNVVVPLGVGSHLEYWGFSPQQIIELDWSEHTQLDNTLSIVSLPARHFSGRSIKRNNTLWTSYMLQGTFGNIFLSGDSGYDTHFQEIKKQFPEIRLAAIENGQYNHNWSAIHMLPDEVVKVAKILNPQILLTIHHSKFALSTHPWTEPIEKITQASQKENLNLIAPKIGEIYYID